MRELYQQVHQALGVEAAQARPLAGGCVGEVYQVRLRDGRTVVVKVDRGGRGKLDLEGWMLEYLQTHSALPVPHVYHAERGLLVLEHVQGCSQFSGDAETHAAELLAQLHGVRGPVFGLERATLIGGLDQPNVATGSWIAFFREQRLLYMAEEALRERKLDQGLYRRLVRFSERLDEFLEEPEQPSLLHGDVWTTNVLAYGGRITAFLDPAVYYGHPEIELAFITLFSTFGERFFARYGELRPLQPGFFELRRDIYNFYPLLVHARLFGSSYLAGITRKLDSLGF